jgi:hypothetical protein
MRRQRERGGEGGGEDLSNKEILSESQSRVSDETDAGEEQPDEILSGQRLGIASHDGGESKGDVRERKRESLERRERGGGERKRRGPTVPVT